MDPSPALRPLAPALKMFVLRKKEVQLGLSRTTAANEEVYS